MLCRTQQAKKLCWQLAISRYWKPRFNDFHRPFKIQKQHSTSFLPLSRFAEKHDSSGVFPSDLMKGQINVGHCKYPLSQMRYAPFLFPGYIRIDSSDASNSNVHFYDMLVASCPKLWTMNMANMLIEIRNAFKGKGWV